MATSQQHTHALWLVLALTNIGCLGSRDSGPPMGEVTGVITYNGDPVEQASVMFFPSAEGALPAVGVTDGAGKYRLATSGQKSGTMASLCAVAIVLRGPYDGEVPEGMSPAYAEELFQNLGEPLIPEKYFSAQTSQLSAEVKPGRNRYDFDLVD